MRTRFAPSPTGFLHIGNIRTAFFSYLISKKASGEFFLRIEDTDRSRSKPEFTIAMIQDMKWLGLLETNITADNVEKQQTRGDIYYQYLDQLTEQGDVYRCYCSDEELMLSRQSQQRQKIAPKYSGKCSNLTPEDWEEKKDIPYALRFRIGADKELLSQDLVRGARKYISGNIGDFVVCRRDGTPSFLFSNVIDDSLMKVDVAIRGEDHLANVPCQQLILERLNLMAPTWGHLSVVTDASGKPLSKRNRDNSVRSLRDEGYIAEAILNYLFRLGHYYNGKDFLTLDQMAENFSLENISVSPVKFDKRQLQNWQEIAVRNFSGAEIRLWLVEFLGADEMVEFDDEMLLALVGKNAVFPSQAKEIYSSIIAEGLEHSQASLDILEASPKKLFSACIDQINSEGSLNFKVLSDMTGCKGKMLYQPLRIALTSLNWGPELAEIVKFMDKSKLIERFSHALGIAGEAPDSL